MIKDAIPLAPPENRKEYEFSEIFIHLIDGTLNRQNLLQAD